MSDPAANKEGQSVYAASLPAIDDPIKSVPFPFAVSLVVKLR